MSEVSKKEPDSTVTISTEIDIVPVRELTAELEKAASAAERLAEAAERVKSVFKD